MLLCSNFKNAASYHSFLLASLLKVAKLLVRKLHFLDIMPKNYSFHHKIKTFMSPKHISLIVFVILANGTNFYFA
jgi:hypothetical protein